MLETSSRKTPERTTRANSIYSFTVRDALHSRAARERGLFAPAYVDRLLADPDAHITPLRGSKLWQLGLLEWWLQTHLA